MFYYSTYWRFIFIFFCFFFQSSRLQRNLKALAVWDTMVLLPQGPEVTWVMILEFNVPQMVALFKLSVHVHRQCQTPMWRSLENLLSCQSNMQVLMVGQCHNLRSNPRCKGTPSLNFMLLSSGHPTVHMLEVPKGLSGEWRLPVKHRPLTTKKSWLPLVFRMPPYMWAQCLLVVLGTFIWLRGATGQSRGLQTWPFQMSWSKYRTELQMVPSSFTDDPLHRF